MEKVEKQVNCRIWVQNIMSAASTMYLPSLEELTPITQSLISPELAIAFSIRSPAQEQASLHQNMKLHVVSSLPSPNCFHGPITDGIRPAPCFDAHDRLMHKKEAAHAKVAATISQESELEEEEENCMQMRSRRWVQELEVEMAMGGDQAVDQELISMGGKLSGRGGGGGGARNVSMMIMSAGEAETLMMEAGSSARALKRPRLVWTSQLHKRFVDAVAHLGMKNAVPKTIMQLMNVEGLTRENVASHLQKYRLYLKRIQRIICSNDGSISSSDSTIYPVFAASTIPTSVPEVMYGRSSRNDESTVAHTSDIIGWTSSQGILTLFPMASISS